MSSQYSISNTYMNIVFVYSNVYITYGYRMFNHNMIKYTHIDFHIYGRSCWMVVVLSPSQPDSSLFSLLWVDFGVEQTLSDSFDS